TTIEGNITLNGTAYIPFAGYELVTDSGTEVGYLVGVAYEQPEIALRVALTYNSEIEFDLDAVDPSGEHTLETSTPESWNLEFQTGIAPDTLLFGSIRWAAWGDFEVPARALTLATGSTVDLADIDDSTDYVIGIGRRFTDEFSGSVSIQYEAEGDELVSPLAPTNGRLGITFAGSYQITEQLTLAGGINYTTLGDAKPQTRDTARADFEDNDSFGIGFSLAYSF
ncbi:MAG: transporter, partial [Pseudomonadota bacterium]